MMLYVSFICFSIYDTQASGQAFTSVEGLLSSMSPSYLDLLHVSIGKQLEDKGFSQILIKELIQAAMRTNYGQNIDIHSFVGE